VPNYHDVGQTAAESVSTGQKHRYTGKPFDDEGSFDLYYYGARYYDPLLGRFIAVDPLQGSDPGRSPYAYCANNPFRYVDPNGNNAIAVELIKSAGAFAIAPFPTARLIAGGLLAAAGFALLYGVISDALSDDDTGEPEGKSKNPDDEDDDGPPIPQPEIPKEKPKRYGRKGGPAHQKGVAKAEADARKEFKGQDVVIKREGKIDTPGGEKNTRFGDVVVYENKKPKKAYQVGDVLKDGETPVSRERKAKGDIEIKIYRSIIDQKSK
jgi:RHS repeat-associated protein